MSLSSKCQFLSKVTSRIWMEKGGEKVQCWIYFSCRVGLTQALLGAWGAEDGLSFWASCLKNRPTPTCRHQHCCWQSGLWSALYPCCPDHLVWRSQACNLLRGLRDCSEYPNYNHHSAVQISNFFPISRSLCPWEVWPLHWSPLLRDSGLPLIFTETGGVFLTHPNPQESIFMSNGPSPTGGQNRSTPETRPIWGSEIPLLAGPATRIPVLTLVIDKERPKESPKKPWGPSWDWVRAPKHSWLSPRLSFRPHFFPWSQPFLQQKPL